MDVCVQVFTEVKDWDCTKNNVFRLNTLTVFSSKHLTVTIVNVRDKNGIYAALDCTKGVWTLELWYSSLIAESAQGTAVACSDPIEAIRAFKRDELPRELQDALLAR